MPTRKPSRWGGSALILLTLALLAGCEKKQPTPPKPPAAEPPPAAAKPATDFEAVTARLDKGGDLFAYLGTKEALAQLSAKVAPVRDMLLELPNVPPEEKEKLTSGLLAVTNLIRESGIEGLRAVGMSSLPIGGDLRRLKLFLYHGGNANSGFLWNVMGGRQHRLEMLDLLPASTALAVCSDADLRLTWSTVAKQLASSGTPQFQEIAQQWPQHFEEATGMKWEALLGSLGGAYGIVLTLDETRTVSIPLGEEPLEIPEPALMVLAKVNDDLLFNRLDEALKQTGQSVFADNRPGLQMRTLALPIPLPLQLGLTVAQSEGYLFLATTDQIVLQALAAKAAEAKRVSATEEFKRLSKDIPAEGNQFSFVSERLGSTLRRVQRQALRMAESMGAEQQSWMRSIFQDQPPATLFGVGGHTPDGWLWVANGSRSPGKFLLGSVVVPAAMAGMVGRQVNVATADGTKEACQDNLRAIEAAKQSWANESDRGDAEPTMDDLLPFLDGERAPTCPGGGAYSVEDKTTHARCSIEDHNL